MKKDQKCEGLIRPYVRGQDIKRWQSQWQRLWMIAMKSIENADWPWSNAGDDAERIFAETYPGLHDHFSQHREKLQKRQDQGRFWWELRSCAYWSVFDKPKIFYQDIMWTPSFCWNGDGRLSNNTVYLILSPTPWLLAVLNSPALWWFSWRNAQHGKDEALRFFTEYVANVPVPDQPESFDGGLVDELLTTVGHVQGLDASFSDWLATELGIAKLPRALQAASLNSEDGVVAAVRKARGRRDALSPTELRLLREAYHELVEPAHRLRQQGKALEYELGRVVNRAYGLTPEEERILWETAPPRMPVVPPDCGASEYSPASDWA